MAKKKPAECPLFKHRNGQWAKKVRGRLLYFGTDLDAALKKWATEKDYHLAGLLPPKRSDAPTVEELANVYYDQRLAEAQRGLVSERHVAAIKTTLATFLEIVGKDATLDTMLPMHWAKVREALFRPAADRNPARGNVMGRVIEERSPTTVDGDIVRIRAFTNWCLANRHYDSIDFGTEFAETSAKIRRRLKADAPSKDMSADTLRQMLEGARPNFKPLILLAINGGMGSTDIAAITFDDLKDINKPECWVDLPRGKTGMPRRFCLWPETQKAIQEYLPTRPKPLSKLDKDIVFLTKARNRWVRDTDGKHIDSASSTFTALRKSLKIKAGTFYGCRHTFATVSSGCNDLMAACQVMGFVPDQNDVFKSRYMQKVPDERILAVTEFVRKWLFLGQK